jgi:hypothetical protein
MRWSIAPTDELVGFWIPVGTISPRILENRDSWPVIFEKRQSNVLTATTGPGGFGDRACRVAEILLELGETRLWRSRRIFAISGRSA